MAEEKTPQQGTVGKAGSMLEGMVKHDVEEAVYLADRIFILSARPGTIVEDVPVALGRPRDPAMKQTKDFHDLQDYVLACLRRAPGTGHVRVGV